MYVEPKWKWRSQRFQYTTSLPEKPIYFIDLSVPNLLTLSKPTVTAAASLMQTCQQYSGKSCSINRHACSVTRNEAEKWEENLASSLELRAKVRSARYAEHYTCHCIHIQDTYLCVAFRYMCIYILPLRLSACPFLVHICTVQLDHIHFWFLGNRCHTLVRRLKQDQTASCISLCVHMCVCARAGSSSARTTRQSCSWGSEDPINTKLDVVLLSL